MRISYTVERLRLRLHICLNLTPVSIGLNFRLIVYYVQTQVSQLKKFESILGIVTSVTNDKY